MSLDQSPGIRPGFFYPRHPTVPVHNHHPAPQLPPLPLFRSAAPAASPDSAPPTALLLDHAHGTILFDRLAMLPWSDHAGQVIPGSSHAGLNLGSQAVLLHLHQCQLHGLVRKECSAAGSGQAMLLSGERQCLRPVTYGCLKSVPATCMRSLQTRLRAALQWYALSAKGQGYDCACLCSEHINNRQDWPAHPHRLRRACPACRGGGTAMPCSRRLMWQRCSGLISGGSYGSCSQGQC